MSPPAPRTVLIAISAHDWRFNVVLATSIYKLIARSSDPSFGLQFSITVAPEVAPVHFARNLLVGIFLKETTTDYLWFIDNDMLPDDSALELFTVDADVVSGRSLATRPGEDGLQLVVTAYQARDPDTGDFTSIGRTPAEPVPIFGTGAANLLIGRAILEDPRIQLDPQCTDLAGRDRSVLDELEFAPPVFRTLFKPNGQVPLSEDIDFVHRAAQLDYRCRYHPGARMGHLKTVDLGSVEHMLARAAARPRDGGEP